MILSISAIAEELAAEMAINGGSVADVIADGQIKVTMTPIEQLLAHQRIVW